MNNETRIDLVKFTCGIGLGFVLAYGIVKCFWDKDKTTKVDQPPVSQENIQIAVSAYQGAIEAGEDDLALMELNKELKSEYGLSVMYRQIDGKYIVKDNSGKEVKSV